MSPQSMTVEPFRVTVADQELDRLARRLADTRWPDRETHADQGPRLEQIRALCEHWATGYDWRRREKGINDAGSFRTVLDGVGVHFLHVRSPEPTALPLLLRHGRPGSILEFRRMIGPLTDPVAHAGRAPRPARRWAGCAGPAVGAWPAHGRAPGRGRPT